MICNELVSFNKEKMLLRGNHSKSYIFTHLNKQQESTQIFREQKMRKGDDKHSYIKNGLYESFNPLFQPPSQRHTNTSTLQFHQLYIISGKRKKKRFSDSTQGSFMIGFIHDWVKNILRMALFWLSAPNFMFP